PHHRTPASCPTRRSSDLGDPHRIYQDHPLQPGWQISNEPGLYGHFAITLNGRRYSEWIGVRIEDDLLITPTGCRNLSASIPKEIDRKSTRLNSSHVKISY